MTKRAVTFEKVIREDFCKEMREQTWVYLGEDSAVGREEDPRKVE